MSNPKWWGAIFRYCVLHLGIQPSQFWQLTLPELVMLMKPMLDGDYSAYPDRQSLNELSHQYPDQVVSKSVFSSEVVK